MYSICPMLAILGEVFVALMPITASCDLAYTNWSREIVQVSTHQDVPFYLGVTSSLDGELIALCRYQFVKGKASTILHGKKDSEGNFWPEVSYEVAVEGKAKWRLIGKVHQAEDSESVTVSVDNPVARLYVDMREFKPMIKDLRWGRVVLENGDAAVFALEDLLPPADRRGASSDFKEAVDEREQTRFGSAAILDSVTSVGNCLTGVFIYSPRLEVALQGTESPDEDLWPSVTLYVGNSEQDWHSIGVASHKGKQTFIRASEENLAIVLRVSLDLYKPAAEKYQYGKVVFSNGSFAVFLIENLNIAR